MDNSMSFGSVSIGDGQACYLIAEVGTTCLGDMDTAKKLVSAAKFAGVNAVKFQVIDPYQDIDADAVYPVVNAEGERGLANMREMFSELSFSEEEWREIFQFCESQEIEFLATCDYLDGINLLESLGIIAHKIGAWDSTYKQLIERIGETGKPMLVDLGPTTKEELEALTQWYTDAGGSCLIPLHDFHTGNFEEMNLHAITYLKSKYDTPVGFSSPNRNNEVDYLSLALGANVIEKRLILDRNFTAYHAHESLEPEELTYWVRSIRQAQQALGHATISPSQDDLNGAKKYYRSIVTTKPIAKGEKFSEKNIGAKRPGSGLPTVCLERVLGQIASKDIPADELIQESDIS